MAHLYISSSGVPWRKHSYSAGNTWDQSPLKYYLQKVLGWREKDNKARFLFGKAIEESIQAYHDHGGEIDIVQDFVRRWATHKDNGDISYTDTERNWATCDKMGQDMVRLYKIMQPKLPIPMGGRSVWQREYSKEVFPGDPNYGGIDFVGKLDIVCYADPEHKALPKINWKPEYGAYRSIIVDIKTSALDFPEQPGMCAFDAQLRAYSWVTGIRDVGFLWLVKKGLEYKKGYSITVLENSGNFQPGDEGVIAKVDGEQAYIVTNDFMLAEMDRAQGKKGDRLDQTAEAKQRVQEWLEKYATCVKLSAITKQRLQFNAGRVSDQSAHDAGIIAARQIVGIVNAWKSKEWPNTFGIRYPHDDRNDSYFRGFVLGDENYKKQNFTKSDEQSFDDLFNEDTQ